MLRSNYETWHRAQSAFYEKAAHDENHLSAPLIALVEKDLDAKAVLERRKQALKEYPHVRRPSVPAWGHDEVVPGSLILFKAPAYDYELIDNHGGDSSVSKRDGDMDAQCTTFGSGGQTRSSATAIGIHFVPISRRLIVRFSAFVKYSYSWLLNSYGRQAIGKGVIGLQLHSWDLNGGDFRRELDLAHTLWQDRTTLFASDSDSGEDLLLPPNFSSYYFLSEVRQYAHWVYAWVLVYADEGGIFGSHARAELVVTVPFVVIEQ
jgi:hypothetical protein